MQLIIFRTLRFNALVLLSIKITNVKRHWHKKLLQSSGFFISLGPDFFHVMDKILKGIVKPIPSVFCPSIAELVRVMLRPEPTRRPTVAQVNKFYLLLTLSGFITFIGSFYLIWREIFLIFLKYEWRYRTCTFRLRSLEREIKKIPT